MCILVLSCQLLWYAFRIALFLTMYIYMVPLDGSTVDSVFQQEIVSRIERRQQTSHIVYGEPIHHLKIDVHVRNRAMKNMELQGKEKEHQFA